MAESLSRTKVWFPRLWMLLVGAAAVYGGLVFFEPPLPSVPTARVERRDFVTLVQSRGEIKSANSVLVSAPQTPDLKIVRLAEDGKLIKRGDVVVEFDAASQEDVFIERQTQVRQVNSEILQAEAQHSIVDEQNAMQVMQSQYNLERAELEASKQEILAEIQGLKNRIDVGIAEGDVIMAKTTEKATDISQQADLSRLKERLAKAERDLTLSKSYLGSMALYAPIDGIVRIMSNSRAQGSFGTSRPPFQEGDTVWTGAAIAEIPDLSSLIAEVRVEEITRGKVELGQEVRVRVDAVPDAQLKGEITWLSPIATLVFSRIPPEKNFPANVSITNLDDRLRPGMSASVDIVVDRRPKVLVIPAKASFQIDGQPTVFIKEGGDFRRQHIKVETGNSSELVISEGIEEGMEIALENPELLLSRRKKS